MKDSERKRPPVKLSLDPSTAELLGRTGNASHYVDSVVGQRWQEWQWALGTVQALGWLPAEILAACDACNGLWHDGPMPGSWLAQELHDAAQLDGLVQKWEIDADRWPGLLAALGQNDQLGHALFLVAREFWAGNDEVERRIRRLAQVAPE